MSFKVNERDIIDALARAHRPDDESVEFAWKAWLNQHDVQVLEQRQRLLAEEPKPWRVAQTLGMSALRMGHDVELDLTNGVLSIHAVEGGEKPC